jgi:hypothetical protein
MAYSLRLFCVLVLAAPAVANAQELGPEILCVDDGEERHCPVHVRLHNFTANPSSGPVAEVTLTNLTDQAASGELSVTFPEGWSVTPTNQKFELGGKGSKLLPLAIEKAIDLASNRYPVDLSVTVDGKKYSFSLPGGMGRCTIPPPGD